MLDRADDFDDDFDGHEDGVAGDAFGRVADRDEDTALKRRGVKRRPLGGNRDARASTSPRARRVRTS